MYYLIVIIFLKKDFWIENFPCFYDLEMKSKAKWRKEGDKDYSMCIILTIKKKKKEKMGLRGRSFRMHSVFRESASKRLSSGIRAISRRWIME